ncbi:MAG: Fur family transcriptional regulator [Minisyncoccota bacterium]
MAKTYIENYPALLRERGLKATPLRIQLIELLAKVRKPISTHEVKSEWQYGEVDTVTLYRALEALVSAEIVRRVDLQHGHTDYELVISGEHHHHLVCTDCGTIEDFEGCPAESIERAALKESSKFSSLRQHSLEFFGVCNACTV